MREREKIVQQAFLDDEEQVLKKLQEIYSQSLKEVTRNSIILQEQIEKIRKKYEFVTDEKQRALLESQERSKIYQKRYQDALNKQISSILQKLHKEEYKTVESYLNDCYDKGFVGTIYSMQEYGIPLVIPIDQRKIVQAVQVDSKISKGLYRRLGEDVDLLKKRITSQISRGFAMGMNYDQMAQQLFWQTRIGYNNAARITRTEGHRVQQKSTMDACYAARECGADVVKQWDATMDSSTRESHQMLDGQIRELDEKFSNGLMYPGDPSGSAAEVINCRCILLQRARWAMDQEELNRLKKKASFYGLDKETEFDQFRKKYLEACEKEQSKRKYQHQETVINKKVIDSAEYRRKFDQVSDNKKVNRNIWKMAKEMLEHRSGTKYEDLAFIDYLTGKSEMNKEFDKENKAKPSKAMTTMIQNADHGTIIAIHNHPGSSVPSISDLMVCVKRGYKFGLVVCHDGKIYKYYVQKEKFNPVIANAALDKLEVEGYNSNVEKMFEDAGVGMEVLQESG